MDRLDLHLKGAFIALMIALGLMSCGLTPLIIWLVTVKDYPRSLDPEGATLRNGQRLLWRDLTERRRLVLMTRGGRKTVMGVGLWFGKKQVKIAPRVLAEGPRVLPYLSRVLGEDLTVP